MATVMAADIGRGNAFSVNVFGNCFKFWWFMCQVKLEALKVSLAVDTYMAQADEQVEAMPIW